MSNYSACNAVAKAVKQGVLQKATRFNCDDCGRPATEYDHRDYNNPLDVDPVCRSCNLKRGKAKGIHDDVVTMQTRLLPYTDDELKEIIERRKAINHQITTKQGVIAELITKEFKRVIKR